MERAVPSWSLDGTERMQHLRSFFNIFPMETRSTAGGCIGSNAYTLENAKTSMFVHTVLTTVDEASHSLGDFVPYVH